MPSDSSLTNAGLATTLAEYHASRAAAIERGFDATGNGIAALRGRSDLLDDIVVQLYRQMIAEDSSGPKGFCLAAVGGYGRQELFPYSDIDLVFITRNGRSSGSGGDPAARSPLREAVAALARALWDLRFKVGHSLRSLAECGQFQRDNLELSISLLDSRYLAGDHELYDSLRGQVIPQLAARDRRDLVADLVEKTHRRHEKQGNTIFHLEPNFKDVPGGLRDYHVCRWLALISELDRAGRWSDPQSQFPSALREPSLHAFEFLAAVRCFVHYRQSRDDNVLSYELQDMAAARGINSGRACAPAPAASLPEVDAAEWMRIYFRHARVINRLTSQLLESALAGPSSLYMLFRDWRSRLSNADFSVVRGRIFPRQPASAIEDPGLLLSLFEMMARHGLELSPDGERWVEEVLASMREKLAGTALWEVLRRLLLLPHAPSALRAMHRTGALVALFPEFRAIDALVIRDFYHRYTVDEHSFMAIQTLHQLAALKSRTSSAYEGTRTWDIRFAGLLQELEEPELLYFALLFHDVGKGMLVANHTQGSLDALQSVFDRLGLPPVDREMVMFLVAHHLDLSTTLQRRDIFDPDTVRDVAERVATPERLKMLGLLTFADINAVNSEALTPWKKEMLWQLYASVSNQMVRSLDEERFHAETAQSYRETAARVLEILAEQSPRSANLAPREESERRLGIFLEGFPKRYLKSHGPQDIATHYRMSRHLLEQPVQLHLQSRKNFYEMTVLTPDRPFLFASLTGVLAAWGMNILKVDAFSNTAEMVLDTFRFVDLYRTLELNADEAGRLKRDILEVLGGGAKVASLMRRRGQGQKNGRAKVAIPTQVHFDDASSSHSTLLELVTQDRLGLLYQVSSAIAELGCSIEVALIDTEGEKAIDVFYLTSGGTKLDSREQQNIRERLLSLL